jgi:hypothetical protein
VQCDADDSANSELSSSSSWIVAGSVAAAAATLAVAACAARSLTGWERCCYGIISPLVHYCGGWSSSSTDYFHGIGFLGERNFAHGRIVRLTLVVAAVVVVELKMHSNRSILSWTALAAAAARCRLRCCTVQCHCHQLCQCAVVVADWTATTTARLLSKPHFLAPVRSSWSERTLPLSTASCCCFSLECGQWEKAMVEIVERQQQPRPWLCVRTDFCHGRNTHLQR